MPNTYRVIQWNTGNVGKSSLRSIAANPQLELVGCYAWSPEKVGRDAGELVGFLPPPYFEATTLEEFMDLGHIMTSLPTLHAIPAVAAAPGIATYTDLPPTVPRRVVPV